MSQGQELAPLDLARIRSHQFEGHIGSTLVYLAEVDSTNRVARERAPGLDDGTIVCTDFQSQGRGRRGRHWRAPAMTSLLQSVFLLGSPPVRINDYVMLASLAVADSIAHTTQLPVGLKWPNDILIHGRKVSGILAELVRLPGHSAVILGMGINGNFEPGEAELPPHATSLQSELSNPVDRECLFIQLVVSLNMWYRKLNVDPDAVWGAWVNRLMTIGQDVLVADHSGSWAGVATGVHRDGGLIVKSSNGHMRTVYAGDVSLRTVEDFTTR